MPPSMALAVRARRLERAVAALPEAERRARWIAWTNAGWRNRNWRQVLLRGRDKVRAVGGWQAVAHCLRCILWTGGDGDDVWAAGVPPGMTDTPNGEAGGVESGPAGFTGKAGKPATPTNAPLPQTAPPNAAKEQIALSAPQKGTPSQPQSPGLQARAAAISRPSAASTVATISRAVSPASASCLLCAS